MDPFIETALIVIGAFWLGWKVSEALSHITFRSILKDLGITDQQMLDLARRKGMELEDPASAKSESELPVLEVKLEQHGSELFAFRKDNDQFLGQGPDRDALIKRLTENLTNVRVIIAKEDGADLLQKNNT